MTSPQEVNYRIHYRYWGTYIVYKVSYILGEDSLTIRALITSLSEDILPLELGWHPYFETPRGTTVHFENGKCVDIPAHRDVGSKILPATDMLQIELYGIGLVTMKLSNIYADGYICIWTDGMSGYVCVEPLISYKEHTPGGAKIIRPGDCFSSTITMTFSH